jgi:anthranilate phosphoribosyltransferase
MKQIKNGGQQMVSSNIRELLYRLNNQSELENTLINNAMTDIFNIEDGEKRSLLLGNVLGAIIARKPKSNEIISLLESAFNFADFDSNNVETVKIDNETVVEVIGSGKKGEKTINVSTAASLLAASAGSYVIKKGSTATSSVTGSSDFFSLLGMNINYSKEKAIENLKKCGFTFVGIENIIPKFDNIYGDRFYASNALSFGLAAIIASIRGNALLYGLSHADVNLSLEVINHFLKKDVTVLSSTNDNLHFIDEVGIYGKTSIASSTNGEDFKVNKFDSKDLFDLPQYTYEDIKQGQNKNENIKFAVRALNGTGTKAHEDIICVNAATILSISKKVKTLKEGYLLAKQAINSGKPIKKLKEFLSLNDCNGEVLDKLLEQ